MAEEPITGGIASLKGWPDSDGGTSVLVLIPWGSDCRLYGWAAARARSRADDDLVGRPP